MKNIFFATQDDVILQTWMEALNVEKEKPFVPIETKKKQGKFVRVKKSVGGKIATSSIGKKIIREMIGKDGVKLLSIIKKIITELHNKETAKETENDVIRIGVKVILLHRNETITTEDLNKIKPRLQRLWHICQDYANIINFDYNPKSIQDCANNFFTILMNVLNGQISEKNMAKIQQLHELVFSTQTLDYLFVNEVSTERRKELAAILEKILQL